MLMGPKGLKWRDSAIQLLTLDSVTGHCLRRVCTLVLFIVSVLLSHKINTYLKAYIAWTSDYIYMYLRNILYTLDSISHLLSYA